MQRLHMIRCFIGFTKDKLSTLYKSIVRPLSEYGSVMWNPWLKKDIKALKEVQAREQKLCVGDVNSESFAARYRQQDLNRNIN